jgi:hypothetical protein
MSRIDEFLALAREYGRAAGLDDSTVSWRIFGDSKKLTAIINGADIQVRRYEKAVEWLSANWPVDAIWPVTIARPAAEAAE